MQGKIQKQISNELAGISIGITINETMSFSESKVGQNFI